MAHPFEKLFKAALAKSTEDNNLLLAQAESLRSKGYRALEVYTVLKQFGTGFLEERERTLSRQAIEEFSRHIDEE